MIKDFRWIRNDFISANFECLQICFKKSIKGLHFSVEGITKISERILVREKQVRFPSKGLVLRKLKAIKVFKLTSKIVSYSSFKVLVNFIFVNEIFNFKFNNVLVFTVHHLHLLFLKVWVLYRSFVKVIWVLSETIVTHPDLTGRFLQSSNRFSNLRRIISLFSIHPRSCILSGLEFKWLLFNEIFYNKNQINWTLFNGSFLS